MPEIWIYGSPDFRKIQFLDISNEKIKNVFYLCQVKPMVWLKWGVKRVVRLWLVNQVLLEEGVVLGQVLKIESNYLTLEARRVERRNPENAENWTPGFQTEKKITPVRFAIF